MKEDTMEQLGQAKGVLQNLIVVASLVHTLTDLFGSGSDLYRKLKRKKKIMKEIIVDEEDDAREKHRALSRKRPESDTDSDFRDRRRHGRSKSRKRDKSRRRRQDSSSTDSDEDSIYASSDLVLAEYQRGYHYLGKKFADGDLIAQNQLQSQIIHLQSTLLTIYQAYFLNPTPQAYSITQHLTRLMATTRAARIASIEALAMQYQRMLEIPDTFPLPQLPGASLSPITGTHDHTLTIREKPRTRAKSTSSQSHGHSHSHSNSNSSLPHSLYCVYALDLQKYPDQPLADAYQASGDGRCPYCKFVILPKPGKAWEIVKEREKRTGEEKVFLVEQRFIVKCHREGGGFACGICSLCRDSDTVCGEARALVDHLWREHTCAELADEVDIVEVG